MIKEAKEYTTLQERIEQLEEINSDLKQSLDWANEREKENTERIVALEGANTVLVCNIRQLGEHCISETRCIMCDEEDKKND